MASRYYIFILLFLSIQLSAQDKYRVLSIDSCTVIVDSLTLIPTSVQIENIEDFTIENNKIILSDCNIGDSLKVTYRTFDFNVETVYRTQTAEIIRKKRKAIALLDRPQKLTEGDKIIDAQNLQYDGSFSRGFSIGNAQDLLLNSKFNLSMYGDLGDGLLVRAAISDDNIPIQPEGNTQVLQEFDKVFIEISKDSTKLLAGDYMLQDDSYFKKYIKKLKGLGIQHTSMLNDSTSVYAEGNFAISRGKYARQRIPITEGNLGPYRLTGNNNERFLIILSGTERVFIDNVLQTRGFDKDYTIDYNRAEITFSPNKFIGPENNIIVEYEYRDQNYLRSLYTAKAEINHKKWSFGADFYTEQDSKNVVGDRKLDSLDIIRMQTVGDDIDNAFITTIYPFQETPTATTITYTKQPINVANDTISYILAYDTDENNDLVQAIFTNVGQQNGRYEIDRSNLANGRVYKYVGKNQGSYEPISNLIPPIKRQMATLFGRYDNGQHSWTKAEFAYSNTDLNRYATTIGNDDNTGSAIHIASHQLLYQDTTKNAALTLDGSLEIDSKNFQSFTRYREAEFTRNWNIVNTTHQRPEQWYSLDLAYRQKNLNISQGMQSYQINGYYNGIRSISNGRYKLGKTTFSGNYDYLNAEEDSLKNTVQKPTFKVEQMFSQALNFMAYAEYQERKNEVRNTINDELLSNSFGLQQYTIHTQIKPNKSTELGLTHKRKNNTLSDKSRLTKAYHTDEFLANAVVGNGLNEFSAKVGIRNLYVDNVDLSPSPEKKSLITQIGYKLSTLNKGLVSSLSFTTSSGQEPRQEVVFEKVEAGQGDYIYIGNADSTLIAANFRYAPEIGTADYIRISLFNDEFIAVNNQVFLQSLRTDFKRIFPKSRWLKKISSIHRLNINRKSQDLNPSFWKQFDVFNTDTTIVTYNAGITNTLFFNKGERPYDASFSTRYTNNIFTQITGRESRKDIAYTLNLRHQLGSKSDILLGGTTGQKNYDSSLLPSRNFIIDYKEINPQLRWIPSQRLKWAVGYAYNIQQQTILDKEKTTAHKINSDFTWRYSDNSNLTTSLIYSYIDFDGEKDSILEFEMLSGLKKGQNYEWEILYTQRLRNNIDLNLSYRGRKSATTKTVHIARMQLKATF